MEHDEDVVDEMGKRSRGFKINSPRSSKHREANRKRTNHPMAEKGRREEMRKKKDRAMRRRRAMAEDL